MTLWKKFNALITRGGNEGIRSVPPLEEPQKLSAKLKNKTKDHTFQKDAAPSFDNDQPTLSDPSSFFASSTTAASSFEPSQYTSINSKVSYDPGLISMLQKEHVYLMEQFAQIQKLAQNGQFAQITPLLMPLRAVLTDHLYKENLKLYIYLQQALQDDTERSAKLRKFRRKMDEIGKSARVFLSKYSEAEFTPVAQKEFMEELNIVVWSMGKRIEKEENILFHLYRLKN